MKWAALVTTICSLLPASMAFAQSMDGDCTTGLRTRGPDAQIITLSLNSDGIEFTGTIYGNKPIPLKGTIEGNTLEMELRVPTSTGDELLLRYTGILEGDEIKFTYQSETGRPLVFGPAAQEFTAQRLIP